MERLPAAEIPRPGRNALPVRARSRLLAGALITVLAALAFNACDAGLPERTPPPIPGTSSHPREVNVIAREYTFSPASVDLVPGETVIFHVVNAGLEIHEAIIGDSRVQDAWETAEASVAGAPPGPTPVVSVPPDVAGLRIVVPSGDRVDMVWTVPLGRSPLVVGCHIPGHWAKGMQVPVRLAPP